MHFKKYLIILKFNYKLLFQRLTISSIIVYSKEVQLKQYFLIIATILSLDKKIVNDLYRITVLKYV